MQITAKQKLIDVMGRSITYYNQRSRDWTHPYEYPPEPGDTLSSAGCGIFSVCFAAEWLAGRVIDPEALADFSCREGGRGDDGTDRPALLAALEKHGMARKFGFIYEGDGHINDPEALWANMLAGGCALCNLRVGHIVALLGCREQNGERQLLAMDSYSESADTRVRDNVREVVEGSEIVYNVKNASGLNVGAGTSYAVYWVPLTLPKDINLLHKAR